MHPFVELMKKIESAGTFSASGKLPSVFPGLVIKDVGEIALPLSQAQAEKIISHCEQAPFGRGEETVIDTEVRNVWQLSPEALEFTNPEWDLMIKETCQEVANKLGLTDCKIKFELYKILVYAKGSFFKEHRDTEKIPNMFATMVINLPSTHEGGELIVRHGADSCRYSFAGKSRFYPEFAVFYADCFHEVKPLISGYRFSLIYNLAIANRKNQPLLSQQQKIVDQVDAYVNRWSQSKPSNPLLVYLLDHSYSEQNLSLANLKNNDFAKASILLKSAEKNLCQAYLCLVSYIRESYGDCWNGDFEEYDVSREEIFAHHFIDAKGEKIAVESLVLKEDELLTEIPLCEGTDEEVSISEATGNEGATKELWYHRGAIILWPEHHEFDLITRIDIAYAIHYFKKLIQKNDGLSGENRRKAILLAHHIMDHRKYRDLNEITKSLVILGDVEVLRKQIRLQLEHNLSAIDSQTIVRILDQFSWQAFAGELNAILAKFKSSYRSEKVLPWLRNLLLEKPSPEGYSLITNWFEETWKPYLSSTHPTEERLICIFQILSLLGKQNLTDDVLLHIRQTMKPACLPFAYAAALLDVIDSCKKEIHHLEPLKQIAESFLMQAQEFYPSEPKAPENWVRSGQLKCACEFCKEVNEFLPTQNRSSMDIEKTLQRNLLHIQDKIAESHLDLDVRIERQANKFKGTVIKNQNTYEQALKCFTAIEQSKKRIALWMASQFAQASQ